MAVLAILTFDGDPGRLLEQYDRHDEETRELPATGQLSHLVARTATGLVVADVWESREHLGAFLHQPLFQSELERVGLPEPRVEVYDVDRRRRQGGAVVAPMRRPARARRPGGAMSPAASRGLYR